MMNRCVALMLASALPSLPAHAGLALGDAVQLALRQNPALAVQKTQEDIAAGQLQQAAGLFDWQLASHARYERSITPRSNGTLSSAPELLPELNELSTGFDVGLERQLRNGLFLSTGVTALRREDRGLAPGVLPQSSSRLDIGITLPLARGRGGATVTVAEDVAQLTVRMRRFEMLDRTARTVQDTLMAYWTYRTRIELERVALSSEQRSAELLQSIERLVAAAEKPRGDLVLVQADYAEKTAAREAAVLARTEAQFSLGRLLGLDAAGIAALAAPDDPLPVPVAQAAGLAARLPVLQRDALDLRPDVRALALQLQTVQRQLAAAREAQKPQIDLNMGVAYTKVSDGGSRYGFIGEAGRLQSAPSVFARLTFQMPLERNAADGGVREHVASLTGLTIRQQDLESGVGSGIERALRSLISNSAQLQSAQAALTLYEQAVAQELVKQRNGISTLIDVLNTESRFVNARVAVLQAQLAYAEALIRLRVESGTVLPASAERAGNGSFTLDVAGLAGLGPLGELLPSP